MKNPEKQFVDEKIALIAHCPRVLDVGGGKPFTKWMKEYRELFKDSTYETMDYDASTGAHIVGDIHAIPLKDESVDGVICSSVLEHVENPIQAMKEIRRILKPSGRVFVYVPSVYPYHARKGHYSDYWRIFDDTIPVLFKGFSKVTFIKRGGYFKALSFFLPLQHKLQFILDPSARFLDTALRTEKRNTTSGYYIYAEK